MAGAREGYALMLAVERPRRSTPVFAGAVCATPGCETILSAYNTDPDRLCALCRRRVNDEEPAQPAGLDLERLIAGILLTHDALHPGESVNLRLELSALGVAADCGRILAAVRHLARRHGLIARGQRGRPGYALVEWERRYQLVHGFGGVELERDSESGKWRSLLPNLLPQSEQQGDVDAGSLSLPGSDDATGGCISEPEP